MAGAAGASLAVGGPFDTGITNVNGGPVTTNNAFQIFNTPVTLLSDSNFAATGTLGNISFTQPVSGAFALGVNSSGTTTFGGAVNVASVNASNATGTTAINGGTVATSGAAGQVYSGPGND